MGVKKVGVLLGGKSAEREISLETGYAIAKALRNRGYEVVEIDAVEGFDTKLREARIDAAFIALHGRLGEDGTVQGMLETLGIPYNGSGVLASAIAMDKKVASTLLEAAGLPVPESYLINKGVKPSLRDGWSLPVIVKPVDEGSSFGITIVRKEDELKEAALDAFKYSDRVMIEEYLEGPEVTVAVLSGKVLGSLEMEPHREFYNYSAKYDEGGSSHHIPPRIKKSLNREILELGRRAYETLLCSGAARVDFIVKDNKEPVILEVNTLPGMTGISLLPEIAASIGISFDDLVVEIIESASLHV